MNRIEVQVESINQITLVCCILHNLLRINNFNSVNTNDCSENATQQVLQTTSASIAYDIREAFADWCVNEGDLDFQYNMI